MKECKYSIMGLQFDFDYIPFFLINEKHEIKDI